MNPTERDILAALDRAVRAAAGDIEPIVARVDRALQASPGDVLAWEPIPLSMYKSPLPETIRSSWVFVLRANLATGAERHPNSHQRMMSFRGRGDFPTRTGEAWVSHYLRSDPEATVEERWISIPPNVWHQGVVGPEDWAVVSFHTVLDHELIEERPALETEAETRRRHYVPDQP